MIDTSLPLTDVHRHLDGNIRAQTILDLGRQFNLTLGREGTGLAGCVSSRGI